MLMRPAVPRHSRLFMLLDQENRGLRTQKRLIRAARSAADDAEMLAFRRLALRSWEQPALPQESAQETSAPEPRRNYEFFRAVRT